MNLFDLEKNDQSVIAEAGYEFEVKLPNGQLTNAFITVRGSQSPVVRQYQKKKYNEYQMKVQAEKRKGREYELSLDDAEELSVEAAVVRVISFRGFSEGGKEVVFNAENTARILKKHEWLREQVTEEANQIYNFCK